MKYYRVRTAPVMPKSKGGREKGIEDTRACKRSQKQKRTLQTVRLPTAQHFGWLKNDSLILYRSYKLMVLFCKSCFGLFQLVSAYSLSHNTIESVETSRLFHPPNQPDDHAGEALKT
jgi:hypothetical protein